VIAPSRWIRIVEGAIMAINEASRHALHGRLDEVLGPDNANTLMEHLPPVGWADVATKHDLQALEGRVDLRFDKVDLRFDGIDRRLDAMDGRFDALEGRFEDRLEYFRTSMSLELHQTLLSHLRIVMFGMISSVVAVGGLVVAAVKL
jgi:hypothetical protein